MDSTTIPSATREELIEARRAHRHADLQADAVLDESIAGHGRSFENVLPPRRVFLTGATGFLGASLLAGLMQRTQAHVHCLVRAETERQGADRVRKNLAYYGLWQDQYEQRLTVVLGNLDRPYLGIRPPVFRELAKEVDVVYHAGAWSNYILPYGVLKPSNVLGTHEALRLATAERLKPIHAISSTSIYPGHDLNNKFFPEQPVTSEKGVPPGYPQTKWVGDRLVSMAMERGVPASIYRVGQLAGHSKTGRTKLDMFVCSFIKGSIQLGVTVDPNIFVELIPIDYASDAVLHLSLRENGLGQIYNLPNPKTVHWSDAVAMINECGYPVRRLVYDAWYETIMDPANRFHENALYPYLPLFMEDMAETAHDLAFQVGLPSYETKNTDAGLAGSGISCAPVDLSLMSTYLKHFAEIGFIPPAGRARA